MAHLSSHRALAVITGGTGSDIIVGTENDDEIDAQGSGDFVLGNAGDDLIKGGAGNDVLIGGFGDDTVYGNSGDDKIYFSRGNDILSGGPGNDVFFSYFSPNDEPNTNPNERGRQIFKIFANENDDTIYGFDPAKDVILVPSSTSYSIRSENGALDTLVEISGTSVRLVNCSCLDSVRVIDNIDLFDVTPAPTANPTVFDDGGVSGPGPEEPGDNITTDTSTNKAAFQLANEEILALSICLPVLLFLTIALFLMYRRKKKQEKNVLSIAIPEAKQRISWFKSGRTTMSSWFSVLYGSSVTSRDLSRMEREDLRTNNSSNDHVRYNYNSRQNYPSGLEDVEV